jgi:RNA polymerase sigma-70 factor (ECF subfamily)
MIVPRTRIDAEAAGPPMTFSEPPIASSPFDPASWVDNHLDVLMGYAILRVRDREVAEDLVQDTLVAAWRAREDFEGRSNERTWLIGILKRKIVDYYRRRWREQAASELSPDPEGDRLIEAMFDRQGMWSQHRPQPWSDPAKAFESGEFIQQLRTCLDGLPPRLAEVFTLRELEGIEGKQICQDLGLSSTNLWQLMHRARLGLRLCLEEAGFGPNG